jgi:hypothetical protein
MLARERLIGEDAPMRRCSWMITAVVLAACARAPAELSTAPAGPQPASQPFVEATPTGPCTASTLEVCAEVCSTRACLEWCGGAGCVDVATELHACAMPAATEFDAANPEPEIEFLPPGPDAPEDVEPEVDPASEHRLMAWHFEREEALDAHWRANCQAPCEAAFGDASPDEVAPACERASAQVYGWSSLVREPKTRPDKDARLADARMMIGHDAGILGQMSSAGAISLLGGSYLTVDDEGLDGFEHRGALARLLSRDANLAGADACVSGLDEAGESFAFAVEFDADGRPRPPRGEVSSAETECLAELLQAELELPAPAVRGLPELRLTVHVREYDDWGGLMGADIGDAYGVGGLGMTGSGVGGGGAGGGTVGGLGGIGSGGGGASGYGAGTSSTGNASTDDDTDDQP